MHTAGPKDDLPCWPLCTGKSTVACHSCPRKLWARSSRCSHGMRELQERHSRMKQGDRHCPAGNSIVISTLNLFSIVGGAVSKFSSPNNPSSFSLFGYQELRNSVYQDLYSSTVQDIKILEMTPMSSNRANVKEWVLRQATVQEVLLREKNQVTNGMNSMFTCPGSREDSLSLDA